jgi:hypothetical protein
MRAHVQADVKMEYSGCCKRLKSRLSEHSRMALILLRKQGSVCDACGFVYVSCPTGTIYLEHMSVLPQINVAHSPAPKPPSIRFRA